MNCSSLTRLFLSLITALVALAGTVGLASPAQAVVDIPSGPGLNSVYASCRPGQLTIITSMSVTNGYYQGQHMVWRYHLTSSYGHNLTSGWSGSKLMPYTETGFNGRVYNYAVTRHSTADLNAMRGALWGIKVQVGRWLPGYGWAYSAWTAPAEVQSVTTNGHVYQSPWNACTT